MPLSEGGHLLLETKILTQRELSEIIAINKKSKDKMNISTEDTSGSAFTEPNFLIGSGLVSSSVMYLKSGEYFSPSNFLDKNLLGSWFIDSLLDASSMIRHPTFYDFIFVKNCPGMDCVVKKLSSFGKELMIEVLEHPSSLVKDLTKADIRVKLPNFIASGTQVELAHYRSYARLYFTDELRKGLWGNKKPREYPDSIYVGVEDLFTANDLLVEVSQRHPDIIIYKGVSYSRIKSGMPCFGGFFVQNGKTIPVDELKCVKKSA